MRVTIDSAYIDASYTINEIRNNVDKESGGALADLIVRFATAYKRSKIAGKMSAESQRNLSQSGHNDGYTVKVENFDKKTIIFKEGEKEDCMDDILSGSIGIYDGYGTADEKLITTLTPNMFFGELGMILNILLPHITFS